MYEQEPSVHFYPMQQLFIQAKT